MAYFKINGVDFSNFVTVLKVGKKYHYKSMVTAAGNTLVKNINSKYVVEVGFRALTAEEMKTLQPHIGKLKASISFLEPETGAIKDGINCMASNMLVEYYTIQEDEVIFKPFSIQFSQM